MTGRMRPWITRGRRRVFSQPPWLTVEEHEIELPDGRVIPDWSWVITPEFVNIVAVTTDGHYLIFRQTKYAVAGETLAVCGGYIEAGERPLATAQRELLEETGHASDAWTALGSYAIDGNRGSGVGHFFLATGARPVAPPTADDLEDQELLRMSRDEVEAALMRGEFKVAPWAANVAMALLVAR